MRGLVKGTVFEMHLSEEFKNVPDVFCLPNVKVMSAFLGKPTEIDRLIVTPWKIYCVEQKSYSSYLKGNLMDEYWSGYTGRTSTVLYNPIMQNFEHIRSLKNAIYKVGKLYIPIENNVVIPDSCQSLSESPMVSNISNFVNKVHLDSVLPHTIPVVAFINLLNKVRVK